MNDYEKVMQVVNEQANDVGLWFIPVYITEDILQRALRRLHAVIEGDYALADSLKTADE